MELTFSSEMDYFLLFQQSSSSTWPVPSSHFLLVVLKRNILLLIGPANWHYRHKLNQGFSFPIFINGKAKCWTLSLQQQQDTDSDLVVNHVASLHHQEEKHLTSVSLDSTISLRCWSGVLTQFLSILCQLCSVSLMLQLYLRPAATLFVSYKNSKFVHSSLLHPTLSQCLTVSESKTFLNHFFLITHSSCSHLSHITYQLSSKYFEVFCEKLDFFNFFSSWKWILIKRYILKKLSFYWRRH